MGMAVQCLKHAQEQGFPSHWLDFKRPSGMQNMSQMCWADQSRQNSLDCSLTHHWICWIFYWGVKWKCELKYSNQFKNCRMGLREMKILSSFTHPHVSPNLYAFLSSEEHKTIYFDKCLKLSHFGDCWLPLYEQKIIHRRKKVIKFWNDMTMNKREQHCIFYVWMNYLSNKFVMS